MSFLCITLLLSFFSFLPAASILSAHAHEHRGALPGTWYHTRDHPVHALFRRSGSGIPTDGHNYPLVGSAAWQSEYPVSPPGTPVDPNAMPKFWADFLETAIKEGKIPDIPQTTLVNGIPTYPQGINPSSSEVCSGDVQCRIKGDHWDAPSGEIALSFDDGPTYGSAKLYKFLQEKKLKSTHFFIGKNILANPHLFLTAFDVLKDDIAVHTWSHLYSTTLSNQEIFAELAFTMKIIHESTGGRLPRFWRPPYGDTDRRVHAIARLLGLTAIVWNHDTNDWQLSTGGTTQDQISSNMKKWLEGSKTPGLIILEHELTNDTAQAFINNYYLIPSNNWKAVSAAEMDGLNKPYQNAEGTTGPVTYAAVVRKQNS
ncbi:glycoside hydrolase/deacetylase [Russula emetica]|nr:glycoside hydrolase/deacetylase [Russula emetica]